jgi:hypothetical protein
MMKPQLGIVASRSQFAHQLFQVLLVGLTLGMVRTVVPPWPKASSTSRAGRSCSCRRSSLPSAS